MQRHKIKELGKVFKVAKAKQDMTNKEIAEAVGIIPQSVTQYLNGRLPSLPTFLKLAKVLNIDLGELNHIRDNIDQFMTLEGEKAEENN